jgi:gliding motility-associated-like protein
MKYRRVVTSGPAGCCTSVSPELSVSLHPPLPTGVITNIADTTVCGGSPVQLKVLLTGTGPWRVTYADNSTPGPVANVTTNRAVVPALLSSSAAVSSHSLRLNRIEDANGCLAVSITGTKQATVYKVPVPNAGNDTSVCGPVITLRAKPTAGTGLWTFPPAAITTASVNPVVTVTMDSSQFSNGRLVQRFYWRETNWLCTSKDSVDVTFYKRISSINAGPDEIYYSAFREFGLKNDPPLQWETGSWSLVNGSGTFLPGRVTGIADGQNQYKWTIVNGKCSRSDMLSVQVFPLDIPEGFSPNNDPDGYNNTFEIRGLNRNENEAELRIINGAGVEVFTTSSTPANQGNWKDWDGTNMKGNDVPEGTYYYVLKITPVNLSEPQSPVKVSGFIILKRK